MSSSRGADHRSCNARIEPVSRDLSFDRLTVRLFDLALPKDHTVTPAAHVFPVQQQVSPMAALLTHDAPPNGSTAERFCHPMDSSRLLLKLLHLTQASAIEDQAHTDFMSGVISPETLRYLLTMLNLRDPATMQHSRRVALLASGIANRLGWSGRPLAVLETAALLHDLGKVGIPNQILHKPGRLSPDEAELISQYHEVAFELLQAFQVDGQVSDIIVRSHFPEEESNGSGTVPLGVRILAVADAYDALTNPQVYRDAYTHQDCVRLMMEAPSGRFDRMIVQSLTRWLESDGRHLIAEQHNESQELDLISDMGAESLAQVSQLCHLMGYLHQIATLYSAMYIVDSDLKFAVWDRGAERLFQIPRDEAVNHPWSRRMLHLSDLQNRPLAADLCPMQRALADKRPHCETLQLCRPDGKTMEAEVQAWPLLDEHGQLHGVVELFRECSQSKRNPGRFQELQRAASHDALTGVLNRGELERQLSNLIQEFDRNSVRSRFCLIFLDIDHFKSINDRYLHTTGDRVLIELTRLLRDELYSGELVGRYGGEEFCVLCPETCLKSGVDKAERLRRAIQKATMGGIPDLKVTASFGVTEMEEEDRPDDLIKRADAALFDSKRNGRNQTTSRTRTQGAKKADNPGQAESLVFKADFESCVTMEVMVHKLTAFVEEHHAKIRETGKERLVLHVGETAFFGGWGKDPSKQPVEVLITFGDARMGDKFGTRRVVQVTITPRGRKPGEELFQDRATSLTKLIRAYFAANS